MGPLPGVVARALGVSGDWGMVIAVVGVHATLVVPRLTVKLCGTAVAALYRASPPWFAEIVHVPWASRVTVPDESTVHTPVVDDVNVGVRPLVAEAIEATEKGAEPKVFVPPV